MSLELSCTRVAVPNVHRLVDADVKNHSNVYKTLRRVTDTVVHIIIKLSLLIVSARQPPPTAT